MFGMSTADWMELQAYRATGLTPEAVQEMVSFPYTADDEEDETKMMANQCVICGHEMPEGDQVCAACREGSSKSAITKIEAIAEFLENFGEKQMAAELAGAARVLKGDPTTDDYAPLPYSDPAMEAVAAYENAWDYPTPEQQKRFSGLLEEEA